MFLRLSKRMSKIHQGKIIIVQVKSQYSIGIYRCMNYQYALHTVFSHFSYAELLFKQADQAQFDVQNMKMRRKDFAFIETDGTES